MADEKLLPCPFCGKPAKLEDLGDHHGEYFNLGCSDNDCRGHYFAYTEPMDDRAKAVEDWNRRWQPA